MNCIISVVIPVYNVEKYIEKCARSIFSQNSNEIEYIFVNDFSTDNSIEILLEIIEQYNIEKSQIKIINHKANSGVATARNTGLNSANGNYIMQIDADDYLEDGAIKKIMDAIYKSKADVIVFDYNLDWGKVRKQVKHEFSYNKLEYLKMVIEGDSEPAVWNKLIRKEVYVENDLNFIDGLNYGEDYLLVPKLINSANSFYKINDFLYNYNRSNVNSYTSNMKDKNITDMFQVLKNLQEYFKNNEPYLINSLKKAYLIKVTDLLKDSKNISQIRLIKEIFLLNSESGIRDFRAGFFRNLLYRSNYTILTFLIVRVNKLINLFISIVKGRGGL